MYRAIVEGIYRTQFKKPMLEAWQGARAESLRGDVVRWLQKPQHRQTLEMAIVDGLGQGGTRDEYIRRLSRAGQPDGLWPGDAELSVIGSEMRNPAVRIVVHQPPGMPSYTYGASDRPTIHLAYNGKNHYDLCAAPPGP